MHLAIYLPLIVPLLAAAAARPLAERLPPRTAAWLLTGSRAGAGRWPAARCSACWRWPRLFRIPLVDAPRGMSLRVVSRSDPAALPGRGGRRGAGRRGGWPPCGPALAAAPAR